MVFDHFSISIIIVFVFLVVLTLVIKAPEYTSKREIWNLLFGIGGGVLILVLIPFMDDLWVVLFIGTLVGAYLLRKKNPELAKGFVIGILLSILALFGGCFLWASGVFKFLY